MILNSCSQRQPFPIDLEPFNRSIGINHIQTIKGNFSQPAGIAVDVDGKIYLVDSGKSRVFVINQEWEVVNSIGRFGWKKGEFDRPTDIAIDNRLRLYIADSGNNRIQSFSLVGQTFGVVVGDNSDNDYAEKSLYEPRGICVDSKGDIFIVDMWNHRILKVDPLGRLLLNIGGIGVLNAPQGIAIDNINNIYVCDSGNHRICKFDFSGARVALWGSEGAERGQFQNPTDISCDRYGNVYVVDQINRRVQVFASNGTYLMEFGEQHLENPSNIVVTKDGYVYISDMDSADVEVFRVIFDGK